jgi:hypothetical protein
LAVLFFRTSVEVRPTVGEVIEAFRERLGDDFDTRIVALRAAAPQPERHRP